MYLAHLELAPLIRLARGKCHVRKPLEHAGGFSAIPMHCSLRGCSICLVHCSSTPIPEISEAMTACVPLLALKAMKSVLAKSEIVPFAYERRGFGHQVKQEPGIKTSSLPLSEAAQRAQTGATGSPQAKHQIPHAKFEGTGSQETIRLPGGC